MIRKLLIANRGEIAIRIARAARELDIETVAIYATDEASALHLRKTDHAVALEGRGAGAYLDATAVVQAAVDAGCDAVHPGYGFLSERADFAEQCEQAGLVFVGPDVAALRQFGDKHAALGLAESCGVPVNAGTRGPTSLEEVQSFFASLPAGTGVMLKAIAGGGGRGMRAVTDAGELAEAYERCASEARMAFGVADLYVEQFMPRARHIEVQVLGDGTGQAIHLLERECSVQRRNQKIVEIAPAPHLDPDLRDELCAAAVRMAGAVDYRGAGTFEFLVDAQNPGAYAFIEANARLQVEHTVTEEITGIDIVQAQLRIASGESLADLQLGPVAANGYAIQARVNMERIGADGAVKPSGGTLQAFEVPAGPGVRVDTFGYTGYKTSPAYDSLLAKVIVHHRSADFSQVVRRTRAALSEFRIDGLQTNIGLLDAILQRSEFVGGGVTTRFLDEHIAELASAEAPAQRYFNADLEAATAADGNSADAAVAGRAGAAVDNSDPLAVLVHGREDNANRAAEAATGSLDQPELQEGRQRVSAPMQGTIVSLSVADGEMVRAGQQVAVMEAMKMEHVIEAPCSGRIEQISVAAGTPVFEGHGLMLVEEADVAAAETEAEQIQDLDHIRPDLQEVFDRHAYTLDENRPDAVARRRKTGHRTARENLADLIDEGSYIEYAPLVLAAQRRRRSVQDLMEKTPGDGMVCGVASVNGALFGKDRSQCVVMSYDYTVLAGTQGGQNHRKKDRLFELAEHARLPLVLYAEGGGGRPGDTDGIGGAGLDCLAFQFFGGLSGLVPLVGITTGRCFAGNAALLGCCDVVIATKGSNIGMGGPAMIEGGGLGVFRPEEVGPMDVQVPNGVVDIVVEDEEEATAVAKKYLSYFQGPVDDFECADQRSLRYLIPENRLRIYDVREVIAGLADTDSVLEVREHFGLGMITSLIRIEGRPMGVIANNPSHLAGAIDPDGADKAARFMQLCDAHDIPLLFLCDTPGIMVGPEVEKGALVRHAARMFVTGSSVTVPFFTIILRKGYGLGAQAMAGGSFKAPFFCVSWPTGEFGGMGLEGAVKLGYRNELAAIEDPQARKEKYDEMVERMYERGKAVNTAAYFEIDDVIDPMESRRWIMTGLHAAPPAPARTGKKRPCIDTW